MKNDFIKRFMVGTIILAMIIGAFSFTACGKDETPKTTTYNVTKGTTTGDGSFSFAPAKAKAGATVTLTVLSGTLKEFTFSLSGLTATKVNDTTYTFIMPKGNVVVSAEFEGPVTGGPYAITKGTVNDPTKGDFEIDLTEANQGDTVTLTVDITDVDWIVQNWNITGNIVTTEVEENVTYTFTMPGNAVTVSLILRDKNVVLQDYTITKGTIKLMVDGIEDTRDLTGLVDFTISPLGPANEVTEGTLVTLTVDIDPEFAFYRFTYVPPTAMEHPAQDPANENVFTFYMPDKDLISLNLQVRLANALDPITAGAITVTEPATGAAALAVNATNYAAAGDNFTAEISALNGDLDGGNYKAQTEYEIVFTLTPKAGWKFIANSPAITINEKAATFALVSETEATVKATFITAFGPPDPKSPDWIYNTPTGNQQAFSLNNVTGTLPGAFDGNPNHSGGVSSTYYQSAGTGDANWIGANLGTVRNIGSVRVTWGRGMGANGTSLDLMVNGVIQVAETNPGNFAPNQNSDAGWTTVGSFANTANTGVAGENNTLDDVNVIMLDPGTKGQWIRLKQTDPFTVAAGGAWTAMIRVSCLEAFEFNAPDLIPIVNKRIAVAQPSASGQPPADTVDIAAPGLNFKAFVTGVSPTVPAGGFVRDTVYTYTIKLETIDGYRFTTDRPYINSMSNLTTITQNLYGYDMTVTYTFPPAGDQILGNITVPAPATGEAAPALNTDDFADEGAPFTAKLSSYGSALDGGNYAGGGEYTLTFALEAISPFTFPASGATVQINGINGTYTQTNATTATVSYKFPALAYNLNPAAVNLTAGPGATLANSASNPAANGANVRTSAFDGNHVTFFQTGDSGANQGWISINLLAEHPIGTMRIDWEGGDGAMCNYDIQINTTAGVAPSLTTYADTGWSTIMQIRRDKPTVMADVQWQVLTMPPGTKAQWVRLKRAAGSNKNAGTENSDWIRLAEWEIYEEGPPDANWGP